MGQHASSMRPFRKQPRRLVESARSLASGFTEYNHAEIELASVIKTCCSGSTGGVRSEERGCPGTAVNWHAQLLRPRLSGTQPEIWSVSWNRQADRMASRLAVLPLTVPSSWRPSRGQAGVKGPWARPPGPSPQPGPLSTARAVTAEHGSEEGTLDWEEQQTTERLSYLPFKFGSN